MLIIRPDHEVVTKYCSLWSEDIKELAEKKGVRVYDLKGKKANRKNFESYTKANTPSLIFVNGHGSAETITGYDDEPLADMMSTPSPSILYARSCDAAQKLGPELVNKGLRTFIGYLRKFTIYYDPAYIVKPRQDSIAGLFLESSNLVVSTLLKEHTAFEAHSRSKSAMFKHLRRMISSAASFEERYAAPAMWSNMTAQIVLGDQQATI